MPDRDARAPARLLAPVAGLAAALVSLTKIGDYDIWYHLRAGQVFLAGGLPAHDPFAFTAADQPLSVQSWLAAVIDALAWRAGGVPGVQLLNALAVAATFALAVAAMRERVRDPGAAWLAALLAILAIFAARFRLGPRPHVLEYLCLALDLWVLQRLRARGRAPLWLVPAAQLVWVNVHGSHVLGLALPLLFLAGEAVRWAFPRALLSGPPPLPPRRHAALLAGTSAAAALATLANPKGWRALAFPFDVMRMELYQAHIGEWQRLGWDLLAGYGLRYTWAFSALALLGLAGFALRRRRSDPVDALLFAVFLALAFRGVRLIPEFVLATLPGTLAGLAPAAARLARGRERTLAAGALAAVALAFPAALLDRAYDWGLGAKERIFPSAALDFARKAGVQGNVFNSFAFGDWLVFHAPERKVFVHGRNEVFPESFYRDYRDAHTDPAVFHRLAERWDLQWAFLEYALTDYSGDEAVPHLLGDPDWVPIYWDRVAAIWVRRSGPNAALADRLGFRILRPARYDLVYLEDVARRGEAARALGEVNALVERAPGNDEAHLAAAMLLHEVGQRDQAVAALRNALAIEPRRPMARAALGVLALERGDRAAARAEFEAALALEPAEPAAIWGLGQLGVRVAPPPSARPAGHP